MLHDILMHFWNHGHKYGVLYLIIKDFKFFIHGVEKLKGLQENIAWVWNKISSFFKRIF